MQHNARNFAMAMLFESGLGFVGLALAWGFNISLQSRLQVTSPAVIRGLVACLPMLLLLVVVSSISWPPLIRLRNQVETIVRELLGGSSWVEIAAICFAAGLGEELLFRGALQPLVAQFTNATVAIAAVGVIFGLAHSLSIAYFIIATLIGCYFGWLMEAYDDLVAPVVAHAVYDFVAIVFIRRNLERDSSEI